VGNNDKRLTWKLGVIQAFHCGRDGHSRAATVRVGRSILRCPIQKLFKLELMMNDVDNVLPSNVSVTHEFEDVVSDSVTVTEQYCRKATCHNDYYCVTTAGWSSFRDC